MKVAVAASSEFPADVIARVVSRLLEKHPDAVVVLDNATTALPTIGRIVGASYERRPDYLAVADRILVFGPVVGPVKEARNAGTPVVAYRPDGEYDVYDENLFVASLISTLDAREVHEDHAPRRGLRPRFDERRVFPVPPGSAADYLATRTETPSIPNRDEDHPETLPLLDPDLGPAPVPAWRD